MKKELFRHGRIVATPGALEAFRASGESPLTFLQRHLAGDWGELDEHDTRENELSLQHGWRIFVRLHAQDRREDLVYYRSGQKRDDIPTARRVLNHK
jgi:hypothetical protein